MNVTAEAVVECGGCDCAWTPRPPNVILTEDWAVLCLALAAALAAALPYFCRAPQQAEGAVLSVWQRQHRLSRYSNLEYWKLQKKAGAFRALQRGNVNDDFSQQQAILPKIGRAADGSAAYVYNLNGIEQALRNDDPLLDPRDTRTGLFKPDFVGRVLMPVPQRRPDGSYPTLGEYRAMKREQFGLYSPGDRYETIPLTDDEGRYVNREGQRVAQPVLVTQFFGESYNPDHEYRWEPGEGVSFEWARLWLREAVWLTLTSAVATALVGVLAVVHPARPSVSSAFSHAPFVVVLFALAAAQLVAGAFQLTDRTVLRRRALAALELLAALVRLVWVLPSLARSDAAGWMPTLGVFLFLWHSVRGAALFTSTTALSPLWLWVELLLSVPLWGLALLATPCQA